MAFESQLAPRKFTQCASAKSETCDVTTQVARVRCNQDRHPLRFREMYNTFL